MSQATPRSNDAARCLVELGMSPEESAAKARLFEQCARALPASDSGEPPRQLFVPGRVEFLGKHTDYAGGRSLLCTVPRGICASVNSLDEPLLEVIDVGGREQRRIPLRANAEGVAGHWSTYAAAVARRLAVNFPEAARGCRLAFASDLPSAAGLSSSSALVVCFYFALAAENNLPARPAYAQNIASNEDLAGYLGSVENGAAFKGLAGERGVGTFGGSEDHTAILCCQPQSLAQYRFIPVERERTIAFPEDYKLLIASSGVVAEKTAAARDLYNRVSLAVRVLVERWQRGTGRQDRSLAAAMRSSPDAYTQLTRPIASGTDGEFSPAELQQRLDQFLEESEVLIPAVGDKIASDAIAEIGPYVERSQAGAEEKLRNQVPETIYLARAARRLGAVAASSFGAGWGGSVWALVKTTKSESLLDAWRSEYSSAFPERASQATFFSMSPGPAATWLPP